MATGTPCSSATPSFAPNLYGARPARASASAAGQRRPVVGESLAAAGEQAAEVGQRDDLAGGAVAGRGQRRQDVGVEQGDQARSPSAGEVPVSGSSRVRSRVASTARAGAPVQPRGGADGAGQHQVALVGRLLRGAHGEVRLQTHAGRDAVHRAGVGQRRQGQVAGDLQAGQQLGVEPRAGAPSATASTAAASRSAGRRTSTGEAGHR